MTPSITPARFPRELGIRAAVSQEAGDRWFAFADRHGVSVTSLIEAFAPVLAENAGSEVVETVLQDARRIDAVK